MTGVQAGRFSAILRGVMFMGPIRHACLAAALVAALWIPAAPAQAGQHFACTCRFAGQDYDLGQCVCISTAAGTRYACCGKVLNNSSWKFSTVRGCPSATLRPAAETAAAPMTPRPDTGAQKRQ